MLNALTLIQVRSTIILQAPIDECWKVCRKWGRQPWLPLLSDGTTFDVQVLEGMSENEVGAVRCSKFDGGTRIYEKLVGIDEEEHLMRWQATAHEDTISPFEEASFINFNTNLRLTAVTMDKTTFAEWNGEFYTDPQFAASMRDTFERWYMYGMLSLKEYMARQMARKEQYRILAPPNKGSSIFQDDAVSYQSQFVEDLD